MGFYSLTVSYSMVSSLWPCLGRLWLVRKWTLKREVSRCLVRDPEAWILGWVLCCLCLLIAKMWATLPGSQGCSCPVFPAARGRILKPWARRNLSSPKSLFEKDMARTTGNVGLWDSSSQGLPSSTGHLVILFLNQFSSSRRYRSKRVVVCSLLKLSTAMTVDKLSLWNR